MFVGAQAFKTQDMHLQVSSTLVPLTYHLTDYVTMCPNMLAKTSGLVSEAEYSLEQLTWIPCTVNSTSVTPHTRLKIPRMCVQENTYHCRSQPIRWRRFPVLLWEACVAKLKRSGVRTLQLTRPSTGARPLSVDSWIFPFITKTISHSF